jgi:hypothetical protein
MNLAPRQPNQTTKPAAAIPPHPLAIGEVYERVHLTIGGCHVRGKRFYSVVNLAAGSRRP